MLRKGGKIRGRVRQRKGSYIRKGEIGEVKWGTEGIGKEEEGR